MRLCKKCAYNPKVYEWFVPGGSANGTSANAGGWDFNQYYSYAAVKAAVDADTRSTADDGELCNAGESTREKTGQHAPLLLLPPWIPQQEMSMRLDMRRQSKSWTERK